MTESEPSFQSLPPEYQRVIKLAQEHHDITITPLQELVGGWSGAVIYLVSVISPDSGSVKHLVLKLARKRAVSTSDEISRHQIVLSRSPADFARQHIPKIYYDRVETKNALAIFYAIAGQSLLNFRTLSKHRQQSQLETLFKTTNQYLLQEWNTGLAFEQVNHPQTLLKRWLGFRLKPGQNIETFLREACRIHPAHPGFIIQGKVFPNPLLFARDPKLWSPVRPGDALVGLQHGDLNTNNILAKFSRKGEKLEGYYLIDFALFKENMPLLYDQRYLEMSFLLLAISKGSFSSVVDLISRMAEHDILDADQAAQQVPIELAGVNAAIRAGRIAFADWVQENHPSLHDDLWGQYWLAGAAAGLSYCHKPGLPADFRLAGLVYAAANLKQYFTLFGLALPAEAVQLDIEVQFGGVSGGDSLSISPTGKALHNLPAPPTKFIGRTSELANLTELLLRPETRLVTLTGPGGTGKTRLGLEAGRAMLAHFPNGVYFVDLAPISDPTLVPTTTNHAIGIREGGGQSPLENLKDYLANKQMLLLLDNFEQIIGAAPAVAELLTAAPGLKSLVTSRTPLNLRGEHVFPVPPLQLPDPAQISSLERLSQCEAVRLFVEQGTAANSRFALTGENAPAVAEICHRLDGLPLAIELAAARVKLLPPQAMLARLSNRLKLLTKGAQDLPARQRTLRDTIDWSYDLLDVDEQTLFARLAVFVGGFTLEAAEAVCDPAGNLNVLDAVESLLNNSLLRQEEARYGQPRFRRLETIREYALERLEASGEAADVRRRHAHYFAEWIAEAGLKLYTPEGSVWGDLIEEDYDNLRAVFNWSQATPEGLELGPGLVYSLCLFWFQIGRFSEGRAWSDRVLASPVAQEPTMARAKALLGSGTMALIQGEPKMALSLIEESVLIWRRAEKDQGFIFALHTNGLALLSQGKNTAARPLLEECLALARELGSSWQQTFALVSLGTVDLGVGAVAEARIRFAEALSLGREVGDRRLIGQSLNNLGEVARIQGDYAQARDYYEEGELLFRELGEKAQVARLTHSLAYVAQHQGDLERAQALFHQSLTLFRELDSQRGMAECLAGIAGLAAEQGRGQWAARLLGAAEALLSASGAAWWPADQVEIERARERMRTVLGDELETLWDQGQSMDIKEAIAFASTNK